MEIKRIVPLVMLILFGLHGCEKADMRGMFVSYESANERFEASMVWNQENPFKALEAQSDGYEIFVMGDSHTGGVGNLSLFMDAAHQAGALAMVAVGDMTTGREKDYQMFHSQVLNSKGVEMFPMVGNHDLYFNGWKEYHARFGSSVYNFTVQASGASDLYICLDSGSGTLGSRQLNWLKKLLEEERPKYRHCVVFSHVNLNRARQTTSTNLNVEELYVLQELFLVHQVDMVITAHDHKKSVESLGNTKYIIMDALLDENKNAGYLKLKYDSENGLEYQFVNL